MTKDTCLVSFDMYYAEMKALMQYLQSGTFDVSGVYISFLFKFETICAMNSQEVIKTSRHFYSTLSCRKLLKSLLVTDPVLIVFHNIVADDLATK